MTDHPGLPALPAMPAPWPADVQPAIDAALAAEDRVLVVLDDDPTGTQTVHGVAVLTQWDVATLRAELERTPRHGRRCVFVLTNSRSLPASEAATLAEELGRHLVEAARLSGREVAVVSRSDSTLRGHFPGEVEPLLHALGTAGRAIDGVLLAPWFLDGGRVTVDGVHFARIGERYVPVGETEFARDTAFGYSASSLPAWVEEKTGGRVAAGAVVHVGIGAIRTGGPDAVAQLLRSVRTGGYVTADAVEDRDVEVVVAGLLAVEAEGRRFVARTGASFVRVRAGIEPRPLLAVASLDSPGAAGHGRLVVVGSHVARSTEQLGHALAVPGVLGVELAVDAVLDASTREVEVDRCTAAVQGALAGGRDVVLATSRAVRTGRDAVSSLAVSAAVSAALVACVAGVTVEPRVLVAKGGITASDVATGALGVRRAVVLGQVQAGVPVWELGDESRFPGMRYVVFPGNVGGPSSLAELLAAAPAGS